MNTVATQARARREMQAPVRRSAARPLPAWLKPPHDRRLHAAWTRTDALVLLAAVTLLATAIVIPVVNTDRSTRRALCSANLQQVSRALLAFAEDHGGRLPDLDPAYSGDVWWWYKERVKPYLATPGSTASAAAIFACPNDRGYTESRPFCRTARFASNSYTFNGITLPGIPNIAGSSVASVNHPARTLLVMEWCAHAPLSWHKSRTGNRNLPFYNNAESIVGYLDGHVSLTQFYYDGYNAAYTQDPVAGYDYKFSAD